MIELLLYLPLVIPFFFWLPIFFPLWLTNIGNYFVGIFRYLVVLRMKLRVDDESVIAKKS